MANGWTVAGSSSASNGAPSAGPAVLPHARRCTLVAGGVLLPRLQALDGPPSRALAAATEHLGALGGSWDWFMRLSWGSVARASSPLTVSAPAALCVVTGPFLRWWQPAFSGSQLPLLSFVLSLPSRCTTLVLSSEPSRVRCGGCCRRLQPPRAATGLPGPPARRPRAQPTPGEAPSCQGPAPGVG